MQHKRFILMKDTGKVFNRQTGQFDGIKAHDERALFLDREAADATCAKMKDAGYTCLVCTVMIWDQKEN